MIRIDCSKKYHSGKCNAASQAGDRHQIKEKLVRNKVNTLLPQLPPPPPLPPPPSPSFFRQKEGGSSTDLVKLCRHSRPLPARPRHPRLTGLQIRTHHPRTLRTDPPCHPSELLYTVTWSAHGHADGRSLECNALIKEPIKISGTYARRSPSGAPRNTPSPSPPLFFSATCDFHSQQFAQPRAASHRGHYSHQSYICAAETKYPKCTKCVEAPRTPPGRA